MKRILTFLSAVVLAGLFFTQGAQANPVAGQSSAAEQQSDISNYRLMATYAAASGDFKTAVQNQTRVVKILRKIGSSDYLAEMKRLAQYYSGLGDFKRSVQIMEETIDALKGTPGYDTTALYSGSMIALAKYNAQLGDTDRAFAILNEEVEVVKSAGEKKWYVEALEQLARTYADLGDYPNAVHFQSEALQYIIEHGEPLGRLDNIYLGLAEYEYSSGDYEGALYWAESAEKSFRLYKDTTSRLMEQRRVNYLTALNYVMICNVSLGNYEKALEVGTQSAEYAKEKYGDNSGNYALTLKNMAFCQTSLGDYDQALVLGTQAAIIFKAVFGESNADYLATMLILAESYSNLGNYGKALEIGSQVLAGGKDVFGERNPLYASSLIDVALYYYLLGNYEKALEFGIQGAEVVRENLGERSAGYATTLVNLGHYYAVLDDYESALKITTEAVEIRKEVLGDRHQDYAKALMSLALVYSDLGNYEKAMELDREAVEIYKEIYGEFAWNLEYAGALGTLAADYASLGDYEKATEMGEKSASMYGTTLGFRHPSYAAAMASLASYYEDLGDYEKALSNARISADIHKEVLGSTHPQYANSLSLLASVNCDLGNYDKAVNLMTEATEIKRKVYGNRNSDYAWALSALAYYYACTDKFNKSVEYSLKSKDILVENLQKSFGFLTADSRNDYWNGVRGMIGYWVMYSLYSGGTDGSCALAYDVELLSKGILLSSQLEFDKVIKESGDEGLLEKYEQLRQDRMQLEAYYKMSADERPEDEIARLENEAVQLEKDLIAGSKDYGDFTRSLTITWKDVRDRLGDGDVAVEFAKAEDVDSTYYMAYVLRKGWKNPKGCYLGELSEFEHYLAMNAGDLYRSRELGEKVWSDIAQETGLKEGERVLFSPDGIFYQLAIEYLPAVGDGEAVGESGAESEGYRTMAEKYQMRRLSSTRELCMEPGSVTKESAVLYGGLRYERRPADGKSADAKTGNAKSGKEKGGKGSSSEEEEEVRSGVNRDLSVGALIAQRGADELNRGTIAYLPGTLAEVENLADLLDGKSVKYREYKEYDGREERFKALSGKAPRLIHIATHGFYIPPTEAEKQSEKGPRDFANEDDNSRNKVVDLSMSRTGLLLSESLPAWSGRPVPDGEDDGILTAKEIAGLDLRGVDLAVLSACSTGLGDITEDGVAGLQRGFKKAGVKTLILSLWKVDDDATRQLMTEFYSNYTSGRSKRESFDSAIASLRSDPKYSAPQFWAAFIMLD